MADEKLREDYEYARKGLNQWKKPCDFGNNYFLRQYYNPADGCSLKKVPII